MNIMLLYNIIDNIIHLCYNKIKKDNFMSNKKKNYVGYKATTNEGYNIVVVEYNSYSDIFVKFEDEYGAIKHTSFACVKTGEIRNPYHKSCNGAGFIGDTKTKENGKLKSSYLCWSSMLTRVFSENYHKKFPTYKNCEISDEWLCYANFEKWYNENYYYIDGVSLHLDKDILHKGNKKYCKEQCVFVPMEINELFTKNDSDRNNLPIGVSLSKRKGKNKYLSICSGNGKSNRLGYYDNPTDAFMAYKTFKENYIKEVADKYKDKIPQKLYDAMYRYEVEITD